MSDPLLVLILKARRAAGLYTNVAFADFLGISRRTVSRHSDSGGISGDEDFVKLLRAVYPRDPALARELAAALRKDLAALGIAKPTTAPPARPPAGSEHVAAVVLAASDALGILPRDLRPGLATIFQQIRSLGVDLEQLTSLLAEAPKAKKA